MELVAAVPAWHVEAVLAVAGALLCAVSVAGWLIARGRGERERRDMPLRRCPLCAAVAVSAIESEAVDALHVNVMQQCGQCRAWRRSVTTPWVLCRHERRLEDDRRELRRQMEQLSSTAPVARRTPR